MRIFTKVFLLSSPQLSACRLGFNAGDPPSQSPAEVSPYLNLTANRLRVDGIGFCDSLTRSFNRPHFPTPLIHRLLHSFSGGGAYRQIGRKSSEFHLPYPNKTLSARNLFRSFQNSYERWILDRGLKYMGGLWVGSIIEGVLLSVLASIPRNFDRQFLPVEPVLWLHLPLAIPPETYVVQVFPIRDPFLATQPRQAEDVRSRTPLGFDLGSRHDLPVADHLFQHGTDHTGGVSAVVQRPEQIPTA